MPIGSGLAAQIGFADEVYTNEVQTISGTPSGLWGINFEGGSTVATIPIAATAAQVQAALEALPNVGAGGVVCTGGALPTLITCTFSGPLTHGRNLAQMTVQGAVTGLTFATTVPGSGYGDAQTVTRFLEFVDEGLSFDVERVIGQAIRSGNRVQRSDRTAPGKISAAGDITFEVGTKGFAKILGYCLGKDPVITTPAGGTLTRDHTITLGDTWHESFTTQVGRPSVPSDVANVDPFTYVGCKVTDWELSMELDGVLTLKMTVDAQNERTDVALATASFASSFELIYFTTGVCVIAGGSCDVTKFTLSGSNGIKTDRHFVGRQTKKEPIANAFTEITGEVEVEWADPLLYNRYIAGTITTISLLAEANSTIETTFKPGLLITLPACRIDGSTPNVGGPDVLMQTIPFMVLNDGTEPITLRYRTTDVAS